MAQSTFSIRMDEQLKDQFSMLCEAFGMNMSVAINVFARAVVRERRIPFEISEGKPEITREGAFAAFNAIRSKSMADGLSDMSLEEINAEIDAVRRGKQYTKFYAVVDTNVLVSALLSSNSDSATVQVIMRLLAGDVIPLYSNFTMSEYRKVMARKKLKFDSETVEYLLTAIEKFGILVEPSQKGIELPDPKDVPFYEIVIEKKDDSPCLVTGNVKHFTREPFVVTPAEFMAILNGTNENTKT